MLDNHDQNTSPRHTDDEFGVSQEADPWGRTPYWLLTLVSPTAVVVYVALCRYVHMDDGCRPGEKRLAKDLNCSTSTVKRGLRELKEAGALVADERFRENGQQDTNRYRLLLHRPPNNKSDGGVKSEPPKKNSRSAGGGKSDGGVKSEPPRGGSNLTPKIDRRKIDRGEPASSPPSATSVRARTSQLTSILDRDGELGPPPPEPAPPTPKHPGGPPTDPWGFALAKRLLPDQPNRVHAKLGERAGALRAEGTPEPDIEAALTAWGQQDRYGPAGLDYVLSEMLRTRNTAPKPTTTTAVVAGYADLVARRYARSRGELEA